MNTTVTRLDQMLYAWLAEPNDSKFEQAFQKYYDAAFGTVVRYLARRAGGADLDLEQMAVDALLKFFCKAGRDRRLASEKIRDTLPGIEPLDGGPIHVRQVKRWTADVAAFHDTAMAFMVAQDGTAERDWKGEIHALAAAIPPLQQQGCHILNAVQSAVARILDPDADRAHQEDSKEPEDGRVPAGTAAGFAARLRLEVDHHSAVAAAVETKLPGTLRFVAGSWTVIESLPALRVPTNGYLFEIAHSVYLDECKARGRRKRGGSGIADLGHAADAADPDDVGSHPLARLELETEGFQSEESPGAEYLGVHAWSQASESAHTADPTAERIGEDFCQQFYNYLCRPLRAAQQAYAAAAARGAASVERKRLESITRKTERVITVLAMRIEGQSQNEIAESLGISRNQVKYIVEQVQEAYEQFATASARTSARTTTVGVTPHVQ